jgi:hypothetical protein
LFHNKRHSQDMGVSEIKAFLTHLAVKEQVAASTQNQAFSALLFLYREVLGQPLGARMMLSGQSTWLPDTSPESLENTLYWS